MKKNHLTRKEILFFIQNATSEQEKKRMQQHLDGCDACNSLMAEEVELNGVLSSYYKFEPSDSFLTESRNRLWRQLHHKKWEQAKKKKFSVRDFLPLLLPNRQLVGALAVFVVGLFAGRIFTLMGPGPQSSGVQALESAVPISHFQIVPSDEEGYVTIQFRTVEEKRIKGKIEDPKIQYALSYALANDTKDNVRLKTIGYLKKESEEAYVQKALIQALEKDENPGVRLKAIKLLKTLPLNEDIKNALVLALFKDTNAGVRIEAAKRLNQTQDPKFQSLLEQHAEEDTFIRSLLSEYKEDNAVSISREK